MIVDHLGLPIAVEITAANLGDRDGLRLLIDDHSLPSVVFADSGYRGQDFEKECLRKGINLKPVPRKQGWCTEKKRLEAVREFVVVAKRWIVERSFAWINKFRRLSKDYEQLLTVSSSMIHLAFIRLLLRRQVN